MTLRRKPRPVWRPPATVPLVRDRAWKALCRGILEDRDPVCRGCGQNRSEAVDHIIPRRLFAQRKQANEPSNLAGLCGVCHAEKTHGVEPALYRGNVQRFERWMRVLETTGPVPSPDARARAYKRLTKEVRR